MTRKSGRNTDGTFGPGNAGKPKGSRHKTTLAIEALCIRRHDQSRRLGR